MEMCWQGASPVVDYFAFGSDDSLNEFFYVQHSWSSI